MFYASEADPLCYPGTNVLINRLGLRDQSELDDFELSMFLTRAEEIYPSGSLDFEHYRAIHHHLFQDVYNWAGRIRSIRIGKGGHWFCYPEHIESSMAKIFAELDAGSHFAGLSRQEFVIKAAHVLSEINAVHPFREGNGRTQLAFVTLLAENAGFTVDYKVMKPERVMTAMIESFLGSERKLKSLLDDFIVA